MAENKKLTAVLLAGALAFYPVINGISVLADDNAGDPEEYSLGCLLYTSSCRSIKIQRKIIIKNVRLCLFQLHLCFL